MNSIEIKNDYIFVGYSDPYKFDEFSNTIKSVAEMCRQYQLQKVLVDMRDMPGKVSTIDRFQLGVIGTEAFRKVAKVALVYRKEEVNWFAETVSVNRGGNVRMFLDLNEAMEWLEIKY